MQTTRLYLVRHGETEDNVNQILQGQTPGKLNEQGCRQARELAEKMEGEHIDVFVSSDLRRALQTCEIIAEPHGKPVVTTPLLRERDWGSFTGLFIPDLMDKVWPVDFETTGQMKVGGGGFLNWIKKEYPGKTVLAVGHGIINKAVQSVHLGKPMNEIPKMMNADVRIIML